VSLVRVAVVGAGRMAECRARAFVATGRAMICGVASRRRERAQRLGALLGCAACFDDPEHLRATRPDAVLIEVPHRDQDALAAWALASGWHVLIGGCLATSVEGGLHLERLARERDLIAEAGYEARYKAVWEAARRIVLDGELGRPVAIRSIALFGADPASWYYSEHDSGGMPLTHMTYAFINPARWIFGEPDHVSAFANRVRATGDDMVAEETCTANLVFPGDVVCNMLAGYVNPGGEWWSFTVLGTAGMLDVSPSDTGPGELRVHRGRDVRHLRFADAPDPFVTQSHAFLDALRGAPTCRNRPRDALGDLHVARAIARSAKERRVVALAEQRGGRA
jgi:predicted dehydrogenase